MKENQRFIRTLKTKIYKYMTSVSKNVYINKLDDIVGEYNNIMQYNNIYNTYQNNCNETCWC